MVTLHTAMYKWGSPGPFQPTWGQISLQPHASVISKPARCFFPHEVLYSCSGLHLNSPPLLPSAHGHGGRFPLQAYGPWPGLALPRPEFFPALLSSQASGQPDRQGPGHTPLQPQHPARKLAYGRCSNTLAEGTGREEARRR